MSVKNIKSLTRKQAGVSVTNITPRYNHGIKVKYTHTNTYCKGAGSGFTAFGVCISDGLERWRKGKALPASGFTLLWKTPQE